MEAIVLGNAVDWVNKIGLEKIHKHEMSLIQYGLEKLRKELETLEMLNSFHVTSFTLSKVEGVINFSGNNKKLELIMSQNNIGLANMGVKKFCKLKLDKLNKIKTKFIISIAGSKIQDYIDVVSEIEKCNGFHVGYEINISLSLIHI